MFEKIPQIRKAAVRGASIIAALGLAFLVSGCVIVPPPYYHPHPYGGYYDR